MKINSEEKQLEKLSAPTFRRKLFYFWCDWPLLHFLCPDKSKSKYVVLLLIQIIFRKSELCSSLYARSLIITKAKLRTVIVVESGKMKQVTGTIQ